MVLSYYVAMRFSWLNPSWAAITVAVVSSGDIGQSLGKGVLRAKGTFLAFLAGLFFIAVFPQDRWLMLLSLSIFLFFVTYKMTGKQGQYAWFVTGFVTLMIVTAPVESPADSFEFAAYRALETLTGIGIWTLVSVFLWPQSNVDSLQKNGRRLVGAQQQLLDIYRSKLNNQETAVDFHTAHDEAVKILAQFGQSVEAANFESIGVRRQFPYWQQRRELSQSYITILARLDAGLPDLHGINIALIMPTLEPLFTELDRLFAEELIVSEEDVSACPLQPVALNLNKELIGDLDHFQRAALEVLFNDLHRCSGYIKEALRPVDGMGSTPMTMPHRASKSVLSLDPDRVHSALFVVASLLVGMLLWIYLNPPGHIGWMQLLPTVALLSAQMPHIRLPLFKLFALTYLLVMPVYVFIMPQLSMFWELGALIFVLTFMSAYFLPGVAVVIAYIAMINMLGISNAQHYDFAAMMNAYVFTMLVMVVLFMLSYILGSPRPEKVFLKMIGRYFKSCEIILDALGEKTSGWSWYKRMHLSYHQQEIRTLPTKLGLWGSQVDGDTFENANPEKLQHILATLQALTYQIDDLYALRETPGINEIVGDLNSELRGWRRALAKVFSSLLSDHPVMASAALNEMITTRMERINSFTEKMINQKSGMEGDDIQKLYRLLGSFRRVSRELVEYVGMTEQVDWSDWQREHF